MKIRITFLAIIVFTSYINAQIYTPSGLIQGASGGNNVGIGTNAPISKLSIIGSLTLNGGLTNASLRPTVLSGTLLNGEIRGYSNAAYSGDDGFLRLSAGSGTTLGVKSYIDLSGYSTIPDMDRNILFGTSGVERMRINIDGNVGIGVTDPLNKFSVNDNSGNQVIASYTGGKVYQSYKYTAITYGEAMSWGNASNIGYMSHQTDKSLSGLYFTNYGDSEVLSSLFIKRGGNVGIGFTNPQNKLDVNGTIHSKKVKVDMNGWSDFVFKKEYELPTLEEVEKHINENGHLKDIPSEEEVLKDGINLGEMNSKLLQKIEELTLYSIEQNKEIKDLKKENEVLKELTERISKVEELLKK